MEIKKVGVVGCGLMGSGITQVCAQSGYSVITSEINETLLNKGLSAIRFALDIDVRRRRITPPDMDAVMGRIKGTTSFADFPACDLIIEAAPENMNIKKSIFRELDKICPGNTILATNTSCLSIIAMAKETSRPDKVLGLHFFNPPALMKLLEVVKTAATSNETLETGKAFGKSLGKTAITAPDTPGFVVNRLLLPFMMESFRMLEAGLATRDDIDDGARLGLGHSLGPLKLADLVGLDTVLYIGSAIYAELKDPLYSPPEILKKMVTEGKLGRKTGKGFYDYTRDSSGKPTQENT
jgi:3-hydroxybutyryl-CoA dehydrogenase